MHVCRRMLLRFSLSVVWSERFFSDASQEGEAEPVLCCVQQYAIDGIAVLMLHVPAHCHGHA